MMLLAKRFLRRASCEEILAKSEAILLLAKRFLRRAPCEEILARSGAILLLAKRFLRRDSCEETWSFYPVSDVSTTLTASLQFFTDGGLYTESLSNGHYP